MSSGLDPDLRLCAVCGRALTHANGSGWLHLEDYLQGVEDHPVVPVLVGEVHAVGSCDFCYAPDPTFRVPVRDFVHKYAFDVVTPDGRQRRPTSKGDWAACQPCAKLIECNDWNGVLRRVMATDERPRHPVVQDLNRRMFRQVRANITGAIRPFEWPKPTERDRRE